MPTSPSGQTNLRFSNLRKAVNGATSGPFSLAVHGRGSAAHTSINDFTISAVGTPTGEQNPVENDTDAYVLGFTGASTLFASRLGSRSANSSWSDSSGIGTLQTNNGDDCTYKWDGGTGLTNLRAVWTDFFNLEATNYGANRDLAVLVDPGGT